MQNASEIMGTRLELYREIASKANNGSIELPEKIKVLITGAATWQLAKSNRYKKLIREGHLADLLELAEIAGTKDKPDCWFAKVCSVIRWDGTLQWLKKVREVAQAAAEVIKRLGVQPDQVKAVFKACWKFKSAVISKAILAQEIVDERGGNKLRLFNYLCWKT